jgi:hypothetical protein
MSTRKSVFATGLLISLLASPQARALGTCDVGDLCTIQTALFGCKDPALIKHWIDTYVEENKEAAETYISEQVKAGLCAEFKAGDKLRITRYIGMRRIEVQRPGETERFIMLLK